MTLTFLLYLTINPGDKPYECEYCGKLFSQSGSRNAHRKRQHEVTLQHKGVDMGEEQLNGEILSVQQEAEMHLNGKNSVHLDMDYLKYKDLILNFDDIKNYTNKH